MLWLHNIAVLLCLLCCIYIAADAVLERRRLNSTPAVNSRMSESLKLYRAQLDAAYLKMVEEYDKAIMTLSGGGLGITFVFIKDFIGTNAVQRKQVLFWTWVCWGLSITFVILSFITSQKAVRRAIEQVNTGEIYSQAPGGRFAALTSVFNHLGALLFFAGLSLFVYFVYHNLGAK